MVRAQTRGAPFSSSREMTASPVPRAWIASAVSKAGLARKLWAAAFSPFCSAGV